MEYIEKTLTGIITHGTNSITFTDDFITNESIIDVYFSSDDIVPTDQEQIDNRLIVSIEPQNYDVSIAVHITNDDTINYADELESLTSTVESLSDTVEEHTNAIISHDEDITNINGDITALDTKIDGLNASNINYDDSSTLYSAMGDINTLETTSKNLVGAINEVKESGGGGGGGGYEPNYTTTEKQVGTFVNSKPIYGRIFSLGSHSWASQSSTRLTEIKVNAEDIIRFHIFGNQSGTRLFYNWACNNDSMTTQGLATYNLRTTSVNFNSGYAYMEYTKRS